MKTRLYSCTLDDCNKSFRDEEALNKHFDEHKRALSQNDKKFACKKCIREFSTRQSLKEHMYTHSCKKTFKCKVPGCAKAFRQSSQLCNHKKIHREMMELVVNRVEDDGETTGLLEQLAVKIKTREFDDIVDIKLPPIRGPEYGIILPSLESLRIKVE